MSLIRCSYLFFNNKNRKIMNDLYWREKRFIHSKHYPSTFLYEQTPQSVPNRLHNHIHLPYASNAYGVYRRVPEFPTSTYLYMNSYRTNRSSQQYFDELNHHRNVSHECYLTCSYLSHLVTHIFRLCAKIIDDIVFFSLSLLLDYIKFDRRIYARSFFPSRQAKIDRFGFLFFCVVDSLSF